MCVLHVAGGFSYIALKPAACVSIGEVEAELEEAPAGPQSSAFTTAPSLSTICASETVQFECETEQIYTPDCSPLL